MYQSIPNQTVLIIEDSRYTNGNCQQLLQDDARPPYRLLTQPYDRPVAALCQAQQIDGIVLDVCAAPLEAFSQIRQQMKQSCPPIVVVGEDGVETAVQLLKAGAADYLVRSRLTSQQLWTALQRTLQPAIAHSVPANSSPAPPADPPQPDLLADYAQQLDQAAADLRASQNRYWELAEAMPQMVWTADSTGRINYWNQRWYEYTGLSNTDTVGLADVNAVHPDERDRTLGQWNQAVANGEPFEIEYRIRRQDGVYRWFICRGLPTRDHHGQVRSWIGTITDIDDQKQLETTLLTQLERYRCTETALQIANQKISHILESMTDAFLALDRDWRITYVNQTAARINQVSPDVLIGQSHWDVWPNTRDALEERYRAAIATQTPAHFDYFYEARQRWYEIHAYPSADGLGLYFRDIQHRKQAEAALAQRETELRLVTNTVPALISFVDAEQRYRFVNHRYETWFSQPAATICGKSLTEVLGEKAYESIRPHVEQVLAGQEVTYEMQIPYKDGGSRSVSATYVPRFNQQGEVEGFVALVNDISDRKRAENEREQLLQREQAAREAAERANRVKDEFLTVLSHELRSPLNPILGWAKLLQKRQFDEAQTAQALAAIERNAKLQTQLIDDLLDVARILRGKLELNQVPLNLATVVESAIEMMRKTAEAKSVTLNGDVPDIGQIYGDNTRLQQILWNLLSNAIKFTPSGGQVNVRLERLLSHEAIEFLSDGVGESERDGAIAPQSAPHFPTHPLIYPSTQPSAYAQITVTDTGKGINPEFLPHIFESFRQEDASITRQYGGLGLGLAIVRYLVNAHGGATMADSAGEGLGATFTICLPLLEVETAMQKTDGWSPQQDIDLAGMRILIVDDEPDARDLLEILLNQHGATTKVAASATEALAAMAAFQPELLISDIGMPDMDGYQLIQHIRTLPAEHGGDIPAIALTAYAREADSQQALASGYQQHIAKPLDLDKLLQTIVSFKTPSEHEK